MSVKQTQSIVLHRNFRTFRDYLVTMVPIAALSTYIYGWRVAVMLLLATAVSFLCDVAVSLLAGQRYDVTDLSSVTFAWTVTLLMPASLSYGVLIFAVAATVLLGKQVYGGYGCYPFHPAAFGYALTAVSFPDAVFLFPAPYEKVPLTWELEIPLMRSPAYSLLQGGVPKTSRMDLIVGDFPGPIGSTFCMVALACLALMIVHNAVDWQAPASFMLTCALWAVVFPRVSADRLYSVLLELICGGIPFAAAYLVAEPTVSPRNAAARFLYGIITGLFTMLISRYGAYEYGICFALLLTGPIAGRLDRLFSSGLLKRKESNDE